MEFQREEADKDELDRLLLKEDIRCEKKKDSSGMADLSGTMPNRGQRFSERNREV